MRLVENILAVIGLFALIGASAYGVLALERHRMPSARAEINPPMARPVVADATVCQRGAGERWKCRVYVRRER